MSIDRCFRCNVQVDTDFDAECYDDVSVCVCKNCRREFNDSFDCDGCGKAITPEHPGIDQETYDRVTGILAAVVLGVAIWLGLYFIYAAI